MSDVTAKVICIQANKNVSETALTFGADYQDGRNKEWASYTPALTLNMTVKNEVATQFQPGQSYLLTFTPEES